jgi:predicted nuclease of predicted toxin-antitoxin system
MKILIDMNLSPDWVDVFAKHGITAVHWSTVGNPRAEDSELMDWARSTDHVVFTHDLDFGAALALTQAESPSVFQVRTQDVTPGHLEAAVIGVLKNNESTPRSRGRAQARFACLRCPPCSARRPPLNASDRREPKTGKKSQLYGPGKCHHVRTRTTVAPLAVGGA